MSRRSRSFPEDVAETFMPEDAASTFVAAALADIRVGGDMAGYIPSKDYITLPPSVRIGIGERLDRLARGEQRAASRRRGVGGATLHLVEFRVLAQGTDRASQRRLEDGKIHAGGLRFG